MTAAPRSRRLGTFRCGFCRRLFRDERGGIPFLNLFCPRCRDTYRAAAEAIRRLEQVGEVERFSDNAVVIPSGLPQREKAA